MDLYRLDNRFRRLDVLDVYESLIWTERWQGIGEFDLLMARTNGNRRFTTPGAYLAIDQSDRVMIIETVENTVDGDGAEKIRVTGRSMERVLEDRAVLTANSEPWSYTGAPADAARELFTQICKDGLIAQNDIIPEIGEENLAIDPYITDVGSWRTSGVLSITEEDGYRVLTVETNNTSSAYADSANSYFYTNGTILHGEAWIKVTEPMAMRTRMVNYGGATGGDTPPWTDQTPEDGWVYHSASTVTSGDEGGWYRFLPWGLTPNGTEGFHVRGYRVTRYTPPLYPEDTIPEWQGQEEFEIGPKSLASALTEICAEYDLGYRIVRHPKSEDLFFAVYSGSDRTGGQMVDDPIIFSPEFNNIENTSELTSEALYKNVAYVYSGTYHLTVFAPEASYGAPGLKRRVMLVSASDITDEMSPVQRERSMRGQGMAALMSNRNVKIFDGEASKDGRYKYGRDYYLGDVVEIRDSMGSSNYSRVAEQIFVSDQEGERSYPTLTSVNDITEGTWLSWTGNEAWEDMHTDTWADQP